MKAAVQYSKLPAAVFCSVTPTVQNETQEKKVFTFFSLYERLQPKAREEKNYMLYDICIHLKHWTA